MPFEREVLPRGGVGAARSFCQSGSSSEWRRVCPRSAACGLNHVLCVNICIGVHVAVGHILSSVVEYEALKDMRVKSVSTGAETPVVKATGGWVGGWVGVREGVLVYVVCAERQQLHPPPTPEFPRKPHPATPSPHHH